MPNAISGKFRSYSIIEILVAATIIILITLSTVSLTNSAYRNSVAANHRLQIAIFAQEKMEIIRNMRDTGLITKLSPEEAWNNYFGIGGGIDPKAPVDICSNTHNFNVGYFSGTASDPINRFGVSGTKLKSAFINYYELNTGDKGFKPKFYLECSRVTEIYDPINNATYSGISLPDSQKPLRFRFYAEWYEYGKKQTYYLNNYITNLGSVP